MLQECLDSLVHQEGVAFELILVDNGSADGSVELAALYQDRFPCGLQVIRNYRNEGFCRANNQGIALARAPLIALLNNDAVAAPRWLAELLTAFDDPEVGMAASKILVYERPDRIDKAGHLIYPDGQNRGRGTGQVDAGQFDRVEDVLWPDGCAAMYRKSMLDHIGGFDEDFFAYADDAELGLRARIAGYRCQFRPGAVVRHHRGATLGKGSADRLRLIERNRILLAAKLFPWSLLWLNPGYYGLRLAAGLWAALRGRGEASYFAGPQGWFRLVSGMVRGQWEALLLLPRTLRKRREIRRFRRLTPAAVRRLILDHRIPLRELSEQAN